MNENLHSHTYTYLYKCICITMCHHDYIQTHCLYSNSL